MSTENRNKVLLGFGALVVVLVAAIALWPPNFRKEDASGAIGAVQKHRAPQITQKDVILGNESVRHEQKVLYADFLADAAKLRAIGTREAGARDIAAMRNEASARYTGEVAEILARAESGAKTAAMTAEVQELRAMAAAAKEEADFDQLDTRLKHLASEIQEDNMFARFDAANRDLVAATSALASARSQDAVRALEEVEVELTARSQYAMTLAEEVEAVIGVRNELKALDDIEAMYAKKIADQDIAAQLSAAADKLDARAVQAIGSSFQLSVKAAEALSQLDERLAQAKKSAATAAMESRSDVAKNIGAVSVALASREAEFRAQANAAVGGELAAIREALEDRKEAGALANQLLEMQNQLGASTPLGLRLANDAQFEAQARELGQLAAREAQ